MDALASFLRVVKRSLASLSDLPAANSAITFWTISSCFSKLPHPVTCITWTPFLIRIATTPLARYRMITYSLALSTCWPEATPPWREDSSNTGASTFRAARAFGATFGAASATASAAVGGAAMGATGTVAFVAALDFGAAFTFICSAAGGSAVGASSGAGAGATGGSASTDAGTTSARGGAFAFGAAFGAAFGTATASATTVTGGAAMGAKGPVAFAAALDFGAAFTFGFLAAGSATASASGSDSLSTVTARSGDPIVASRHLVLTAEAAITAMSLDIGKF